MEKPNKQSPDIAKELEAILEDQQFESIELEIKSLFRLAQEKFPPKIFNALAVIGLHLSQNGLPLRDACLLANVDYEVFSEYIRQEPLAARIIETKELQYKRDLMKTLSDRAKGGDDKLAQWLLMTRYPEEFGDPNRRGKGKPESEDLFAQAMEFVRNSGDAMPLVNDKNAVPVVVSKDQKNEYSVTHPLDHVQDK